MGRQKKTTFYENIYSISLKFGNNSRYVFFFLRYKAGIESPHVLEVKMKFATQLRIVLLAFFCVWAICPKRNA